VAAEIIDGKKISAEIKDEVKIEVEKYKQQIGKVPGLAVVLVGEDPASKVYVRNKGRACEHIGIYSEQIIMDASISQQELMDKVNQLNNDPKIDGILVQSPLPEGLDEGQVINNIDPAKDVDGFHPFNVGRLLVGADTFMSCTPAGVQQLLVRSGVETEGKHVVIVGRSNIVGKPMMAIMVQKQAGANSTVTVCHSRTADLPSVTRQADILIAAIGRARFVTADMVSEGTVVIDVGINRIEDSSRKSGYRLVGDVDYDLVAEKVAKITPVPGGVGPMTIAMLMYNTLKSFKARNNLS
jgi:methylenetetrahydrofolate dehydrogenase (NADP+) / methenyltetrahydrofolate cyclohydrolase